MNRQQQQQQKHAKRQQDYQMIGNEIIKGQKLTPYELLCKIIPEPFYRIAAFVLHSKWQRANSTKSPPEVQQYTIFVACNLVIKICGDGDVSQNRYFLQLVLLAFRELYPETCANVTLAVYETDIAKLWKWRLYRPLEQAHTIYLRKKEQIKNV